MLDATGKQVEVGLTDEEVEEIYKATGDRVTEVKVDVKEERAGKEVGDKEGVNWSVKM